MVHNLSLKNSLASQYMAEIRDAQIQKDRLRYRRNLERLGAIFSIEISKKLEWADKEVVTPLGIANCKVLKEQPVLATILRAGLPLHNGLLDFFDNGDSAFISAFRKHDKSGDFSIKLEYASCPSLENRVLIVSDPMIATGASMVLTIRELFKYGKPKKIHVVTAIASTVGIEHMKKNLPEVHLWAGDIDDELTAKAYIVPGLGDAGDLAFGEKIQD
ncbi:MAG: uracil phosphoribosyltransferase [Chitinophagaceae bacterium]|nr:MAG: uracil phosphoribosyltransferase [Chitinophagaceae bacterium]